MKIGFATVDWAFDLVDPSTGQPSFGGAGYYRVNLPAQACAREADIDVVVGGLVANDKTGELCVQVPTECEWLSEGDPRYPEFRKGSGILVPLWGGPIYNDCDIFVLQRWMYHDLAARIPRAQALGQMVVNDIDDWFWGLDPRNSAFATTHPKNNDEINLHHYRDVLAASDLVTTSTPYLAERLRPMLGDTPIMVLRNMIEPERFDHAPAREQTTIGWVGGTPWRSGDLETLRGVLGPFLKAHPEVRCLHGGHAPDQISFAELAGVDPLRVDLMPMMPTFAVPLLYDQIDIGLVPLTMQPFNFAKSAIKGMEYTAGGAAFIAAETPEYLRCRSAGMGFTARKPKDWRRYMEDMLDPELRAKAVQSGRNFLDTQTVDARGHEWVDTYRTMF